MSTKLVRIYASARVDHLSKTGDKWGQWEPICGQKLKAAGSAWVYCDDMPPYPGTRVCARCAALSDGQS